MTRLSFAERINQPEPAPKMQNLPDEQSVQSTIGRVLCTGTYDRVRRCVAERARIGKEKYGTYLFPNDGRNTLVDACQEALDLVVYLGQARMENKNVPDHIFWDAVKMADTLLALAQPTVDLEIPE